MKIAITATAPNLDANVDPRFGRCPFFLIVETDDLSFEAIENPSIVQGSGAGIQSAQLMAEKGVQHVLTGNCGPNAHQTLAAADIAVSVGCSGSIREVVEQFKAGQMNESAGPNVAGHYGTSGAFPGGNQPGAGSAAFTPGMGMGMGGGRGMGMGGGRGMGMGGGRGMGMGGGMGGGRGMGMGMGGGQGMGAGFAANQAPSAGAGQDELAMLKQQAQAISQQMQQIQQRIQQLEQKKG